jgi:hypothetical protein
MLRYRKKRTAQMWQMRPIQMWNNNFCLIDIIFSVCYKSSQENWEIHLNAFIAKNKMEGAESKFARWKKFFLFADFVLIPD